MSPLQAFICILIVVTNGASDNMSVGPEIITKVCCNYQELKSLMMSMEKMMQQQSAKITTLENLLMLLKSGTAACPNGYVKHRYSCYKVSTKALQQQQALTACQAEGGSLLAIESSEEQQFIEGLLRANSVGGVVWIGGHDRITEGKWIWESTKAPIWYTFYTNWQDGKPDNKDGYTGAQEDCLEMSGADGTWNDIRCDHPASRFSGFVCEINV